MDLSIIYTKTGRGTRALINKLPPNVGQVLAVIDGQQDAKLIYSQLNKMSMQAFEESIRWLVEGGFITIVLKNPFPSSIGAPRSQNDIQVSEISLDEYNSEDDKESKARVAEPANVELHRAESSSLETLTPQKTPAKEDSSAIIQRLIQANKEAEARADEQARAEAAAQKAAEEIAQKERAKAQREAQEGAKAQAMKKAFAEAEAKAQAEREFWERTETAAPPFTKRLKPFLEPSSLYAKLSTRLQRFNLRKLKRNTDSYLANTINYGTLVLKNLLILSLILLVVAAVAAMFVNLKMLKEPIERIAAQNLNEPITVKKIHVLLLPTPYLSLENVSIGTFSNSMDIQKVRLYFSLNDLKAKVLEDAKTPFIIQKLTLEDASIKHVQLQRAPQWLSSLRHHQQFIVEEIDLSHATWQWNDTNIADNNAVLLLHDNQVQKLHINTQNKALEIVATPSADNTHYELSLKAHGWRVPFSPNLLFLSLEANGSLDETSLSLSPMTGELYNGHLKANLSMQLHSGGVSGDYELEKINLTDFAMDAQLNSVIDGALSMRANFALDVDTNNGEIRQPKLNGRFTISNGNIRKIDIFQAMRSGNLGGITHFSELSGDVSVIRQEYQFSNLLLRDNKLEANGYLIITPQNTVSASINSKVLFKSNPIQVHMNIVGNTNNLVLKR